MTKTTLILGSGSAYRKRLLDQLSLPSVQIAPNVDESLRPQESPRDRATRLGQLKATSISAGTSIQTVAQPWLIIASDQVCHFDGAVFRKPGTHDIAAGHLARFSGNWVTFSTSIVLLSANGDIWQETEDFAIKFRALTPLVIDQYLKADEPYDCAGSIKVESQGIRLLADSRGRDINSLYGLPVMAMFDGLTALNLSPNDFK